MIRERKNCRLCYGPVSPVFALAPTPIANNYRGGPDHAAERYPLELTRCDSCGHVQIRHVINGLFEDYKYQTPQTARKHLEPLAAEMRKRFPDASSVLEIGSNNGIYLSALRSVGFFACGVDPAAAGIGNEVGYFGSEWASQHERQYDLIVANNVLAHVDNLRDVFEGIEMLLKPSGALVFEVQYFNDLVASKSFDMIYHEHRDYHTANPLRKFLRTRGFVTTRCERIPTHGGSIRITAQRSGEAAKFNESAIDWQWFATGVNNTASSIKASLRGRKVVALGAAAKATTLIHHCDIADSILFAVDDEPRKHGRYIPGTGIEIRPTAELGDLPAFLTAWNYEHEFRARFPNNELINPFAMETA